jgi:hypothetical protein
MRQIKVNVETFNKYRSMFKGQKIAVYENCAWTPKKRAGIPPTCIQHIIVNDSNKVLEVITFNEELDFAKKYHDNIDLHSIESAQKEVDWILDKPNRDKKKAEKEEKWKEKQEKVAEESRRLREEKERIEAKEAPFKNTLGNFAKIGKLK